MNSADMLGSLLMGLYIHGTEDTDSWNQKQNIDLKEMGMVGGWY